MRGASVKKRVLFWDAAPKYITFSKADILADEKEPDLLRLKRQAQSVDFNLGETQFVHSLRELAEILKTPGNLTVVFVGSYGSVKDEFKRSFPKFYKMSSGSGVSLFDANE